jgi:hypothetical protein
MTYKSENDFRHSDGHLYNEPYSQYQGRQARHENSSRIQSHSYESHAEINAQAAQAIQALIRDKIWSSKMKIELAIHEFTFVLAAPATMGCTKETLVSKLSNAMLELENLKRNVVRSTEASDKTLCCELDGKIQALKQPIFDRELLILKNNSGIDFDAFRDYFERITCPNTLLPPTELISAYQIAVEYVLNDRVQKESGQITKALDMLESMDYRYFFNHQMRPNPTLTLGKYAARIKIAKLLTEMDVKNIDFPLDIDFLRGMQSSIIWRCISYLGYIRNDSFYYREANDLISSLYVKLFEKVQMEDQQSKSMPELVKNVKAANDLKVIISNLETYIKKNKSLYLPRMAQKRYDMLEKILSNMRETLNRNTKTDYYVDSRASYVPLISQSAAASSSSLASPLAAPQSDSALAPEPSAPTLTRGEEWDSMVSTLMGYDDPSNPSEKISLVQAEEILTKGMADLNFASKANTIPTIMQAAKENFAAKIKELVNMAASIAPPNQAVLGSAPTLEEVVNVAALIAPPNQTVPTSAPTLDELTAEQNTRYLPSGVPTVIAAPQALTSTTTQLYQGMGISVASSGAEPAAAPTIPEASAEIQEPASAPGTISHLFPSVPTTPLPQASAPSRSGQRPTPAT